MLNKRKHDYEIRVVIRDGWEYTYKYFFNTNTSVLVSQRMIEEKINE